MLTSTTHTEAVATDVVSGVTYVKPSTHKPINYMVPPPPGTPWENCDYELRHVRIRDARQFVLPPTLDSSGYERVDAPTAVRNFHDSTEVTQRYYPELRAIALQATGGLDAHVFDHLVRQRTPGQALSGFGRNSGAALPGAATRVHNDYTEASGRRRLALVMGDEFAQRFNGRFAIVNVWRSILGPVLDAPLALCDARSVPTADLVDSEIRYAHRQGEVLLARHSLHHRWAYYPALQADEALVFKQFDTQNNVARFTLHAAFEHPDTPPDAPPRQSIEARILVLF